MLKFERMKTHAHDQQTWKAVTMQHLQVTSLKYSQTGPGPSLLLNPCYYLVKAQVFNLIECILSQEDQDALQ